MQKLLGKYILNSFKINNWYLFFIFSIFQFGISLYVSLFVDFVHQSVWFYSLIIFSFFPFFLSYYLLQGLSLDNKKFLFLFVITSILLGLCFFPVSVNTDHDVYLYKWEGYLLSQAISPYAHPPLYYEHTEIVKNFPFWQELQFKDYTAIYPYVSQLIFLLDHKLFGFSFLGTKLLFLTFLLSCIPILIAIAERLNSDKTRIWLFTANPLVLYETVGSVHNDIILVFFFLLSLLFVIKKQYFYSGLFLALSIATKYTSLFLFPLFIKLTKNSLLFFSTLTTLMLIYIPSFFIISIRSVFSTLIVYENRWTYTPGVYGLIEWILQQFHLVNSHQITTILYWVGFFLLLLFFLAKKQTKQTFIQACTAIIGYILIANSVLFPWYVIWMLCLVPFQQNSQTWLILSITALLIPLNGYGDEGRQLYRQLLVWTPVYLSLLFPYIAKIQRKKISYG